MRTSMGKAYASSNRPRAAAEKRSSVDGFHEGQYVTLALVSTCAEDCRVFCRRRPWGPASSVARRAWRQALARHARDVKGGAR